MFEILLNSLEADRIKLLMSPSNEKVRGLATSFFSYSIPLESTTGKSKVSCLRVVPKIGNSDKILSSLFREMLFGKRFKVYHWHIVFNVLLRTLKKDRSSEAILSMLLIVSAHARRTNWRGNMKPVKTILFSHYGEDDGAILLDKILKSLPVSISKKKTDLNEIVSVTEDFIVQRKPRELARIGVGYKDQGSLNSGTGELDSLTFDFEEKEAVFEDLLRQVKNRFKRIL